MEKYFVKSVGTLIVNAFYSLRTDSSREGLFCTALFQEGLLFGC